MTKYAITGHTRGIGKRLYERLSPNAIGFSFSTGYNITNPSDRANIIEESKDCDIFINNAPASYGQTLLFLELFTAWKDQEKTIINVGSAIADHYVLPQHLERLLRYQSEKLILKEMSTRVSGVCKVKYRKFGYVGTEGILRAYPHFTSDDYITEDQAVDIILS